MSVCYRLARFDGARRPWNYPLERRAIIRRPWKESPLPGPVYNPAEADWCIPVWEKCEDPAEAKRQAKVRNREAKKLAGKPYKEGAGHYEWQWFKDKKAKEKEDEEKTGQDG